MSTPGRPAVPPTGTSSSEHRRVLAAAINNILGGKINVTIDVTLAASAGSTTITDARIGYYSAIVPAMAMTAHAAAELATGHVYVPQATIVSGQAVVQHTNNSQTDRTIRFLLIG